MIPMNHEAKTELIKQRTLEQFEKFEKNYELSQELIGLKKRLIEAENGKDIVDICAEIVIELFDIKYSG